MTWNWQQSDWPHFSWDSALLRKAEQQFLVGSGLFAGIIKHLDAGNREMLLIEAISTESVSHLGNRR